MSYLIKNGFDYDCGDGHYTERCWNVDYKALQEDFNNELLTSLWQDDYTITQIAEAIKPLFLSVKNNINVFETYRDFRYKGEIYENAREVYYELTRDDREIAELDEEEDIAELMFRFIDDFTNGKLNDLDSYKKLELNGFESLAKYA